MKTTQRTFSGMVFLSVFLAAFVLSGCHRARKAPSDETIKEGTETNPAPPEKGRSSKSSSPPVAAPASSLSDSDPIANGSILLNPAVPGDAEMIQKRLIELGLYRGPVTASGEGAPAPASRHSKKKILWKILKSGTKKPRCFFSEKPARPAKHPTGRMKNRYPVAKSFSIRIMRKMHASSRNAWPS